MLAALLLVLLLSLPANEATGETGLHNRFGGLNWPRRSSVGHFMKVNRQGKRQAKGRPSLGPYNPPGSAIARQRSVLMGDDDLVSELR
ncbi:hypothetical protein PENTCL1PPCAC_4989 [Pristionchus entomophagus]|uniref:Uncharacterized protein n=1 Tax=Pristionchus entomophagus TaxID=358040 RepID=A0AAV5SNB1_9BILA|nr:hypothetical protein PENTCL1PPCAC_4989 [Pristionchus entomophagus]